MGKTTKASPKANATLATKPKHGSKKSKDVSRKTTKQQQEADLAGFGSQFWQGDETKQSSSTKEYPKDIRLD